MSLKRLNLLILMACCALLAACGNTSNLPASTPTTNPNAQRQTVDGITIALEQPPTPALNTPAAFVITVTDANGQPVDGADVYLALEMPTMPMGTNKPVAQAAGGGVYRAQGVYDMTGDWVITVHAAIKGTDHVATFKTKV